jgi:glycosyltransferase involved in cell wall biosynthesis
VQLSILGEGKERKEIENYVLEHKLNEFIFLEGNQNHQEVKKAYQENHFVVLPSKSEGWPKVIAEGMFWGCLPIATQVSCIGNMLDHGKRGLLLKMDLDEDVEKISAIVKSQSEYNSKVEESICWSRKYTIDLFENEIRALLHS